MTTSTIYSGTFDGHTSEVQMITASKGVSPSFDIVFDGVLDLRIPATSAWQAEKKMAIDYARAQLGLPTDVEPEAVEVARVAAPWAPSVRRQAKMGLLFAEISREHGSTKSAAALLAEGRAHAATWAGYGKDAFNHEMDRLVMESNDQCEVWDLAAREKVIVY
jgi:hypothetical protein